MSASMMTSLPGIHWQDVFPTRPARLLTGVPAFLGVRPFIGQPSDENVVTCLYAPNQPQVLHLWPQFLSQFAPTAPNSWMAEAVQGFFENGGQDCVVCWLEDDSKESLEKGLTAVEALASVDLICAPGITDLELQALILAHCAKSGDRFAILDAPDKTDIKSIRTAADGLRGVIGCDYGAFYSPWLKTMSDKHVPPCGHVAGVYAASDQADIARAPANIALAGVLDIVLSRQKQTALALLNDDTVAINSIRSLRGRGVRIWGARTLSSNPEWRYVTVRRLAIMIQRWVNLNLAQVAFEPNGMSLWQRIERELNAYLETLWQKGHLQGTTPAEAFRVRCDAETNPPEQQDRGEVITYIAIAPTVPNEFIQVRLIHGETGVELAVP